MKQNSVFSVLRILADGKEHSGEEIAHSIGCSRTLVWQLVSKIKNDFLLTVNCVRGHGYQLLMPIEWLDVHKVHSSLNEEASALYSLSFIEQIDSTNSNLMQCASNGAPHGLVLGAEWQTCARGRQGKHWQTKLGGALTFSVLWRFSCALHQLSGLSLAVGLAIIRVLRKDGVNATLKWPNDVLIEQKKLAGILIELTGDALGPIPVIIGIGLNLIAPEVLDQPACGLTSYTDIYSRNQLLAELLNSLYSVLETFSRHGFAGLREEWESYCAHLNRPINLILPNSSPICGLTRGVDNKGALLVETSEGMQSFQIGEVSLRAY